MGTRCGDVDAGVLAFLERAEKLTAAQSEEMLNKKSGLLGLSGISSDMREILKAADEGNHRALLALKAYCYRVRKYLGSYVASMGGLDAVAFTGGIGENDRMVRGEILTGLRWAGVEFDEAANAAGDAVLHPEGARVAVWIVPAEEERQIAMEAMAVRAGEA